MYLEFSEFFVSKNLACGIIIPALVTQKKCLQLVLAAYKGMFFSRKS